MLSKSELYARRAFASLLSATVLANTALVAAAQQPATQNEQSKPQKSKPALTPEEREMKRLYEEGVQALNRADFLAVEKMFQIGLDKAQATKNEKYTSLFWNGLGTVYYHLGQFNKALDYYNRALAISEKLGDSQSIAADLNNVGSVYDKMGQFDKALDYYNRALVLKEKLDDPQSVATSLNNVGNVCFSLGQFDKAFDYYNRALALLEKLDDLQSIAVLFNNLGNVYESLDQLDKALKFHNDALALRDKFGNSQSIARGLNNVGSVYDKMGKFDKALDYYNRALVLKEKLGNPQDIAASLNNVGNVYFGLGQFDKAFDYYNRALDLREKLGNPQDIAASLNNVGNVYFGLGQFDKAQTAYEKATGMFESVSEQVGDAEQIGALQNTSFLYVNYAKFSLRQQHYAHALSLLERGRAQGLARQLAQSRIDYATLFSPQDAVRWREANVERTIAGNLLGAAENRLARATQKAEAINKDKNATQQQKQAAEEELTAAQMQSDAPKARDAVAEQQLMVLRNEMRIKYPQFGRLSQHKPPTATQLADLARLHPDTLYLQWAVSQDQTLLLALGEKDGVKGFHIAEKAETLKDKARNWRNAIEASGKLDDPDVLNKDKTQYTEKAEGEIGHAHDLYQTLFAPLTKAGLLAPGRYRRLVLVGDGPLLDLPLAALVTEAANAGKGGKDKDKKTGETRLLDRYAVSTAISFGVLTWPGQPNGKAEQPLFCVADTVNDKGRAEPERFPNALAQKAVPVLPVAPIPDAAVPPRVIGSVLRAEYGKLDEARKEGRDIVGMFPGATGLAGSLARESDVRAAMAHADILHFAVHNTLVPNNPLRSWLLLAEEDETSAYDGRLEGREVASMQLAARMAVLSACESGRGQQRGGDGLMGMAWAFQGAGCPCVVASQWKVEDISSHHLMIRFYEELKAGRRKDEAMQTAMQAVRREQGHNSPYFWGSFEVIGDTSPLFAGNAQAKRAEAGHTAGVHASGSAIVSGRGAGRR